MLKKEFLTWRIINSLIQRQEVALELVLEAAANKGRGAGAERVSMGDHLEKGQHALLNEGDENEMVRFQPHPVPLCQSPSPGFAHAHS